MRVAVIDNRISARSVRELSGKEISCCEIRQKDCLPMPEEQADFRSHGTVCAALLAEFLPEAEIVGLSALSEQSELLVEHVCAALEWCLEQKMDCVCLSLGTTNWLGAKPMRPLCRRLTERGTQIVCAAGNEGILTFPAAYPGVIGVRYEEDTRGVQRTKGAWLGYDLSVGFFDSRVLERLSRENKFFLTRSSSMAAPYAAGQLCKSADWSCHAFPPKEIEKPGEDSAVAAELEALPSPFVRLHGAKDQGLPLARRFQSDGYTAVQVSPHAETDWGALTMRAESFADLAAAAHSLKELNLILLDFPEDWDVPQGVCDLEVDMAGRPVEEVFEEIVSAFETQGE